ncbi:L-amino-acid oxidase-like [Mytilus californianus]|uniref:L-amino-acid oxidase-like n=1 Tax=Mytilus californianus TaxID=6549 RepID=UPI0022482235|nr:L-amino-acid oxidase-like [Mytilus californianus]
MSHKQRKILSVLMVLQYLITSVLTFQPVASTYNSHISRKQHIDERTFNGTNEQAHCDDIAIIGAGIAGTYASWRLRQHHKRISIYEYSNRVGGRMHTVQFPDIPDINVELGAMRFHSRAHALLHQTIRQLGLPIKRFDLGSGPSPDTIVNVRGVHLRFEELGGNKTPYRLQPNERKPTNQLTWELFRNNTDVLTTNVPETYKKFYVKDRSGVHMYKQSVQSLYHKYLSAEAQHYIRETFGFASLRSELSASHEVQTSPPTTSSEDILTVATGFSTIPKTLLQRFLRASIRHSIKLNHDLKAIRKRGDGCYNLFFEPTITRGSTTRAALPATLKTTCAKKVILATNRLSLEKLDWQGLYQPRIREYITKAVKDIPASKLYFSYDSPWWRRSPVYSNYIISDTPLRQTYDFGTSKLNPPKSVLQAMYMDSDVPYWEELFDRGYLNETIGDFILMGKEFVQVINKYLASIYKLPVKNIPTHAAAYLWKNYPFGGAWQTWMPGYVWPTVERQMTKPSTNDDVFVVSNAFNSRSLSLWSNGALQSVELAMPYFGLKPK